MPSKEAHLLVVALDETDSGRELAQSTLQAATAQGFVVHQRATPLREQVSPKPAVIVIVLGAECTESAFRDEAAACRKHSSRKCFIAVLAPSAKAVHLQNASEGSAQMVAYSVHGLLAALAQVRQLHCLIRVASHPRDADAFGMKPFDPATKLYRCPFCHARHMIEDALWQHVPLFHTSADDASQLQISCPICAASSTRRMSFAVHLYNKHGPPGRGEMHSEDREHALPMVGFALVVCRRPTNGKYLLVNEVKQRGFWLPGGRLNPGEQFTSAAVRETAEEAGVDVDLQGVLRVEYTPQMGHIRMRVIFYAHPKDNAQELKSLPDYESMGAVYISLDEHLRIPLRGNEPTDWITYLESGKPVAPMSILTREWDAVNPSV